MSKLCFGTFMTVLVQYKSSAVTQKKLCGKFLGLIDENWDISDDDGATSKLINGYSQLSAGLLDKIADMNPKEFCRSLREKYISYLNPNCKDKIIAAIIGIIEEDENIKSYAPVELLNGYIKKDILTMNEFIIEEFITGIFWYVANYTTNATEEVKALKALGVDRFANNRKINVVERREQCIPFKEIDFKPEKKRFSVNDKCVSIAILLGGWSEAFKGDSQAALLYWGEDSQTYINEVRAAKEKWPDIFEFENRQWTIIEHKSRLIEIAGNIFDDDIDHIFNLAKDVFSELNPKYDLPEDKRHLSGFYNRNVTLVYSKNLRHGLGETIAIISNNAELFVNCSDNKIINSVYSFERELFNKKDWKIFASMSDIYDFLGEACPDVFLEQIEVLLSQHNQEFERYFKESETFIIKEKYGYQLAEIIRMLARKEEYFSRCIRILFQLSLIDNKYETTIVHIVLPWLPQTDADIAVRVGVFKGLSRINTDQTWKILMKLMPRATTSSSMPVEPKYISVKEIRESVTHKEYYDASKGYIEIACKMLAANADRIIELFDAIDDVDNSLREYILQAIKDNVALLNESDLEKVWNKKQNFIARHRRFADAEWSLKEEQLASIEEHFSNLFDNVAEYEFVRLFRSEQYQLLKEYTIDNETMLYNQQVQSMEKVYLSDGIAGIVERLSRIENKLLYGTILAKVISQIDIIEIIENHSELLGSDFMNGLLKNINTEMREYIMAQCDFKVKPMILANQEPSPGVLAEVKKLPKEMQTEYFKQINVWGIGTNSFEDQGVIFEGLVWANRIADVITYLYYQISNNGCGINPDIVSSFLLDQVDDNNILQTDIYYLQQILVWLEENPVKTEKLSNVEWKFLAIFDESEGLKPLKLWEKLENSPAFFIDIIKVICGKDDYDYSKEERQKVVQQCVELLSKWKRLPGLEENGEFNYSVFEIWYKEIRGKALEANVEALAFNYVGKLIFYATRDVDFFINRNLADLLESENIEHIRIAYESEAINSRGVHNIDISGETEFAIERTYLEMSKRADEEGYIRLAAILRSIAKSFHLEGLENIKYGWKSLVK